MNTILNYILVLFLVLNISACNFNKSASTNLISGLTTQGDGISVERVFLRLDDQEVNSTRFNYAQKLFTVFEHTKGFTIKGGKYYPAMEVTLLSKTGDTVMYHKNVFENNEGFEADNKSFTGSVVLARPIYSGEDYYLHYTITDIHSDGIFYCKQTLNVLPNPAIKISTNGLETKECYLFSVTKKKAITDGEISFDEQLVLNFQELNGYKVIHGKVNLGLKIKVTDANNNTVLFRNNVLGSENIYEEDLKNGIIAQLKLRKMEIKNPYTFAVQIWDNNSDAKLDAVTQLTIVE